MMRRKGVPCSCESDSLKCGNKVRKIDGISPDPNGEFTIEGGNGISINTGENKIVIINDAIASSFVAGDNIEINPSGDDLEIRVTNDISVDNVDVSQDVDVTGDVNVTNDVNVGGDLKVTGDIIQQGSSYETHAEQVYTTKDYIYMREGAVGGLGVGDYSGFEVIKYDGTNDGRLVIDKDGVARVGDVGDEQPLLTRDETGDLTNGNLLEWDGTNQKAVDSGTNVTSLQPKIAIITNNPASTSLGHNTPTTVATLTATKTGTALFNARLNYSYASTGTRVAGYQKNNDSVIWLANPLCDPTSPNTTVVNITYLIPVNNGDTVKIKALQTSGSTISVTVNATMIII